MAVANRQLRFINEYTVDGNGAAAAVRAGYSRHSARVTASQLLAKPNIRAAVRAHQDAAANELAVTRKRVLSELQEAVDLARERQEPMAMIAALREQARLLGYYEPEVKRVELSASGEALEARMRGMSDEELLAMAMHCDR